MEVIATSFFQQSLSGLWFGGKSCPQRRAMSDPRLPSLGSRSWSQQAEQQEAPNRRWGLKTLPCVSVWGGYVISPAPDQWFVVFGRTDFRPRSWWLCLPTLAFHRELESPSQDLRNPGAFFVYFLSLEFSPYQKEMSTVQSRRNLMGRDSLSFGIKQTWF